VCVGGWTATVASAVARFSKAKMYVGLAFAAGRSTGDDGAAALCVSGALSSNAPR
jgi:hypothetical protein